jgi:hypothetical protein
MRFLTHKPSIRSTRLPALAVGLLLAGLNTQVHAIIGGEPDFEHPSVGALVSFHPLLPGNPLQPLCTATLISPDVAVTAGHCTFLIHLFGLPAWVSFDQQFSELSNLVAATAVTHPDFSESTNPNDWSGVGGDSFEIGVLLLAEPVTDRSPAVLPTAAQLDELKRAKKLGSGTPFTLVGYGAFDFVDGFPAFDGQRRAAEVPFTSLRKEAAQFSAPALGAAACFGDSGSPNFLTVDGQPVLTSVTWWLGPGPLAGPNAFALSCFGWHRAYRLDTSQARDFLSNFLAVP